MPNDQRFGWVGLFSRDWYTDNVNGTNTKFWASAATFYVVPVRSRNKAEFNPTSAPLSGVTQDDPTCDLNGYNGSLSSLEPVLVDASFASATQLLTITKVYSGGGTATAVTQANNPASESAWAIVSSASNAGYNGSVLKLGNPRSSFVWEITPDAQSSVLGSNFSGKIFIVGRGIDPAQAATRTKANANSLLGNTQSIGIGVTVLPLTGDKIVIP